MYYKDIASQIIDVGDIVIFTEPGAGRNLPGIRVGEVIDFGKASVKVKYVTPQAPYRRLEREEMVDDLSAPPYFTDNHGRHYYPSKPTGNKVELEPVSIKYMDDRFYIVRKI